MKSIESVGWESGIMNVTPELASDLLKTNSINRTLRKGVVKKYALSMKAGHWQISPDPICIDSSGVLLNGQHRLHAVIEAAAKIPMFFMEGVKRDVFKVMDRGAPRNFSDALGIDRKLSEVARLYASIFSMTNIGASSIPDYMVKEAAELLSEAHDLLPRSTTKVFRSAPFRLAACCRILLDPSCESYVVGQYIALCHADFDSMSAASKAVAASVMSGRITAGGSDVQRSLFARAWVMFDPDKKNNAKVQIKDPTSIIMGLRELLGVQDPV
jgi:hypothetical protein